MKTFLAFGLFMIMTTAAVAGEPKAASTAAVNNPKQTAMSPAEHLKLASHFRSEADQNDAQGEAYEQAAARYRRGPFVKNLMSPTTTGRFEFIAKECRDRAKADRILAESHRQMAQASAGF